MRTPQIPVAAILLLLCCLLATCSSFQNPLPRFNQQNHQIGRLGTSLPMGLRSFIKQKVSRFKENKDDDKNGSLEGIANKTTRKQKKKKVGASNAPKRKGINIPKAAEPVADVKASQEQQTPAASGTITSSPDSRLPRLRQESVKDRLNRVRSGKMTDDEKQAFLKTALSAGDTSTSRKPLRQALPDESRPANSTGNATPYPKDSLLTNMARGWGSGSNSTERDYLPRTWKDGASLEDQKKKKAYFDMVTNPNRFHTYKSSMVTQPGETDKVDPTVHDGLVIPQTENEKKPQHDAILEEEVIEEIREYEQTAKVEGDLGSRLEKAAHALEEAAKQKEIQRKEKEARMEKQRQEQRQRLLEIQKKQQLEMEKRELELKAKRREEEEAAAIEREKKRKEEEARRKQLEAEQDAYWARQLQAEKEARMRGMTQRQKDEFVKHEVQAEVKALEIAEQEKEALEAMEAPKGSPPEEVPVEARIDIAAADYLTTKETEYEARMEKKRLEAEQARDEQLARLKALNSPLPTPSTRGPPTATPVVPPASFATRGASELSNLRSQPAPPPAEMPKSEPTVADMMSETDREDIEAAATVGKASGPGFFSRVMGGSKKSDGAPEKRRVVRQKLPLGDDEDEEFAAFDRNGPNRKMSIADAMSASGASASGGDQEQRSKMWGVDMSRIAKSLEDEKKQGK